MEVESCPQTVKKIFVSLTPRLRHDCVISNDVGSVARKGLWYDHERMATFWKAKNGCDNQFFNRRCDPCNAKGKTKAQPEGTANEES